MTRPGPTMTRARRSLALMGFALGLPQCASQSLSASDGGHAGDATVEGSIAGDGAADAGTFTCEDGFCNVDAACRPPTLTGRVFDPAGLNPLADVAVFIPSDPAGLPAISPGSPSCTPPPVVGQYVAAAVTDATGLFRLQGVATGSAVPVTVFLGKWRRTVTVTVANACGDNPVPDGTLRLPKNRSEGDMPKMALVTGGADNLACLLQGIGVDANEFTAPGGGGRVEVYRGVGGADVSGAGAGGAGDCTGPSCPLWASPASLAAYDVVLLGCEGGENLQTKPAAAMQSMHDWLGSGGRLFAVHFENVWFSRGPADFRRAATWVDGPASGAAGPFQINTALLRGMTFQRWAQAAGAADVSGAVALDPQYVATSVADGGAAAAWILDESTQFVDGGTITGSVKALTVSVPPLPGDGGFVTESSPCGKALLTDIHPGGTAVQSPVPSACAVTGLSAGDKALEFLFFDEFALPDPSCAGCPPQLPQSSLDGG